MFLNIKHKKGFTIIELLIVLAIVAFIMPLGINAFLNTRNYRKVSESASNFRDIIKNARSMSLSVTTKDGKEGWPVAYEVIFNDRTIETYIKYTLTSDIQYSSWNPSSLYNSELYSVFDLDDGVIIDNSACDRVVFTSVDGEMFIYKGSYSNSVSGDCEVELKQLNTSRFLIMNSKEKKFDLM